MTASPGSDVARRAAFVGPEGCPRSATGYRCGPAWRERGISRADREYYRRHGVTPKLRRPGARAASRGSDFALSRTPASNANRNTVHGARPRNPNSTGHSLGALNKPFTAPRGAALRTGSFRRKPIDRSRPRLCEHAAQGFQGSKMNEAAGTAGSNTLMDLDVFALGPQARIASIRGGFPGWRSLV